ncbi:magnesium chelatase [Candidatus Kaiserbacteria bacterium CG10_big_fil_rev_8_21_14_0_10_59_10]|uniref:Magnesium chelatase n=1 Tax=Candidatus Kaiserbacteria bacterium CG10_big_fil_rev_8_21_14_0_10_59_10 TaxID=1974612 RepID=A0A2H0U817_9BACT|nr:MAG: magnesium chelatase [Candidatus Kaiserbacteria bacterium CG10_big_fil_rev_8_21_14_0_10_59_10]
MKGKQPAAERTRNAARLSGFARVFSAQPALPHARIISVECDIAKGLHSFSIVGLPDKAVEEAKDRVASAIKNAGSRFDSPKKSNKKIVISLAPAELKKEGAAFDLGVALAYLRASEQLDFEPAGRIFAGELALDGSLRPVRGALSIAVAARDAGFAELFVPAENAAEAALVSGITIFPARTLSEVIGHIDETGDFSLAAHRAAPAAFGVREPDTPTLDDIRGQESAKRGLIIAAAGAHNIALYGPPGTGKTMLARAAAALLPPLTEEEVIEVTCIHSLAGALAGSAVLRPPFRAPHHTSSYASLIGGGTTPRPGEVTLAHRGVLFVDEFPEFHRDVVNALREPLEDRVVSVSRAKGSAVFPASFMLVAALNPCPCGYWGSPRCECMPNVVEKYRRKISGPVADRIDMWVHVGDMPLESLSQKKKGGGGETERAREAIARARSAQAKRFAGIRNVSNNADMKPKHIEEFAKLTERAEAALLESAARLRLSARGFHRTIKLARTVADLAGADAIDVSHMLEALQYRQRDL